MIGRGRGGGDAREWVGRIFMRSPSQTTLVQQYTNRTLGYCAVASSAGRFTPRRSAASWVHTGSR
eukprot:scaffold3177_cov86-Phaeocystis_antarctica.AAC.9